MKFRFRTGSVHTVGCTTRREITYLHTKKVSVGPLAFRDEFSAACNWSIRIWEKAAILLPLDLCRQRASVNMSMLVQNSPGGDGQASSSCGTSDYKRACDYATTRSVGQPHLLL